MKDVNQSIATGRVESLCINGTPVQAIHFDFTGLEGDHHSGFVRQLNGHDGVYVETSSLRKGDAVFNWRTWTGLSKEEITEVEKTLGVSVPQGCLLENITFSGIPNFSKLLPTSRLVFPKRETLRQAILAVWEENGPCHGVGGRLAKYHKDPGLSKRFIAAAQHKRGVMGLVFSEGVVAVGDEVLVYPPAE